MNTRSGRYIDTGVGYKSFVPSTLPPDPPIKMDSEMQTLLSMADRKLGRLDGITEILPNPDLFVAMYVKKEALISSQIEGTQASLVDILDTDNTEGIEKNNDIADVVNYVAAMDYGLKRLETLPISLRLIREIHAKLIKGVRGSTKNPGEFRKTQNWIGPKGCTLQTASFVPPSVPNMIDSMSDLENFIHNDEYIPPLLKIAMIHAQFETIHPFLDGNGRMGRLLITFWLCEQKILSQPLLYLSYYFKKNRTEYYDRLMDVRFKGAWEEWIKFFLNGVAEVADEATQTAKRILELKEDISHKIADESMGNNAQRLLDYLFYSPVITRNDIVEKFGISSPTAGDLIESFCNIGVLKDVTPDKKRYKKFSFSNYIEIITPGTD